MDAATVRTTLGVVVAVAVVGGFVYRWVRWTRTTQSAAGSWKHTLAAWTSLPRPNESSMSSRRALFLFGPPVFAAALAWGLIGNPGPWWHRALGVVAILLGLAWAATVLAYLNRPVEDAVAEPDTTGAPDDAPA